MPGVIAPLPSQDSIVRRLACPSIQATNITPMRRSCGEEGGILIEDMYVYIEYAYVLIGYVYDLIEDVHILIEDVHILIEDIHVLIEDVHVFGKSMYTPS